MDLTRPLRWQSATQAEQAELADLQANILKGHGRDFAQILFLGFDPKNPAAVRDCIRGLPVTDAWTQLQAAARFRSRRAPGASVLLIWLTAAGYRALGVPAAKTPSDPAFQAGMPSRGTALNDPPKNQWVAHFRHEVHAAVLVADDSQRGLTRTVKSLRASLPKAVRVLGIERGHAIRAPGPKGEGLEHFGFVDGRSQPLMLEEDVDWQRDHLDGTSVWNPAMPLGHALVADPGSSSGGFGSYLVFPRLRQDVPGFRVAERRLAHALSLKGPARARAGAMLVGRFRDGTPLVAQHAAGVESPVPNNFDYRDDPEGLKCPFQAHIRKVNPRGESIPGVPAAPAERAHGIVRRGIPYGRASGTVLKGAVQRGSPAHGEVGLLFMCYQADIGRQFEFMQARWANNRSFVSPNIHAGGPVTGLDPIIGQSDPQGVVADPGHWFNAHWGGPLAQADRRQCVVSDLVTLRGGEYFFAPSLSALKAL